MSIAVMCWLSSGARAAYLYEANNITTDQSTQASSDHYPSLTHQSFQFTNSDKAYLFTMCTYGITRAVQGECTKQPQHKIETRLRKRCLQSPKPDPPCDNPTHNIALDQLPSRKGGACPACRDSGIAVEVYQVKWVDITV
ncbi:hypothetical protein ABVK25_011255 [Lepraria finkii]|uniref:Uncharacterized protein n=1 Tax=Lepraria finkii TaxID=1340010 RepID=A0ABR4AWK7_9LECA